MKGAAKAAAIDMLGNEIRKGTRICRLIPSGDGYVVLGTGKVVAFEGRRVRWLDDEGNWHVSATTSLKVLERAKERRA